MVTLKRRWLTFEEKLASAFLIFTAGVFCYVPYDKEWPISCNSHDDTNVYSCQ